MDVMDAQKEPRRAKRWWFRPRLWLTTVALCVLLPCLGLICGGGFVWARQAGVFLRWHPVGVPPEGVVEIVTGDTRVVYVRTAVGAVYGCQHIGTVVDSWMPATEPLQVDPEARLGERPARRALMRPLGPVVDMLDVTVQGADFADETCYVLLADGTVWQWAYWDGPYVWFAVFTLGLIAGVVAAVLAVVAVWVRAWRRSRQGGR